MKKYYGIALILTAFCSCGDNNDNQADAAEITENKIAPFFPVTSFFRGQLVILDSLPVTPLQITTIKGKADSAWIQKKDLKPLLAPFLSPVITGTNLTKYFKETSFKDQTLNAVTFTYDPITVVPDSISLRHWDVYVHPESGNVFKVYLVKNIKDNNQELTQQLTWQANKSAKISTILNKQDGSMELLKEVVFVWDFSIPPKM